MNLDLRVPLVLAGVFLQPVKSRRERSKTECASAVGSSFISVCGNGTTVCPPFGCEVDWLWYGRAFCLSLHGSNLVVACLFYWCVRVLFEHCVVFNKTQGVRRTENH